MGVAFVRWMNIECCGFRGDRERERVELFMHIRTGHESIRHTDVSGDWKIAGMSRPVKSQFSAAIDHRPK